MPLDVTGPAGVRRGFGSIFDANPLQNTTPLVHVRRSCLKERDFGSDRRIHAPSNTNGLVRRRPIPGTPASQTLRHESHWRGWATKFESLKPLFRSDISPRITTASLHQMPEQPWSPVLEASTAARKQLVPPDGRAG